MELVSMTCRNCGGKLQINKEADQIICQNCGTEYLVSINEGAISIKFLSQDIQGIKASTDKTASELALVRLGEETEHIINDFLNINNKLVFTDMGKSFLKSLDRNNPSIFRVVCEKVLANEEKNKKFFNSFYITDLKIIRDASIIFDQKYLDIQKRKQYHLGIVNQS